VKGRVGSLVTALVLVAVGFLLGSFWLQWRHARLGASSAAADGGAATVTVPEGFSSRVRVEVLNGAGEKGAAEDAASRLRAMGFDVVYFGNAESFDHRRTEVVARTGDPAAARRVADSLGLDSVLVRPDTSLYLDATVVLGKDWSERLARPGPSGERPGGESLLDRVLDRVRP